MTKDSKCEFDGIIDEFKQRAEGQGDEERLANLKAFRAQHGFDLAEGVRQALRQSLSRDDLTDEERRKIEEQLTQGAITDKDQGN